MRNYIAADLLKVKNGDNGGSQIAELYNFLSTIINSNPDKYKIL
ncbi:hypothetical protein [Elizabethkingia anophelis]|nr:hypothetical protein [Elizabethkingia anophelis]